MPKLTKMAEVEYYVCDVCSEECHPFHRQCVICNNYVCSKADCHAIYRGHAICKPCWSLQETFLTELTAEWEASVLRQVDINRRWAIASIKLQGERYTANATADVSSRIANQTEKQNGTSN